jgi:hypothetical protein
MHRISTHYYICRLYIAFFSPLNVRFYLKSHIYITQYTFTSFYHFFSYLNNVQSYIVFSFRVPWCFCKNIKIKFRLLRIFLIFAPTRISVIRAPIPFLKSEIFLNFCNLHKVSLISAKDMVKNVPFFKEEISANYKSKKSCFPFSLQCILLFELLMSPSIVTPKQKHRYS